MRARIIFTILLLLLAKLLDASDIKVTASVNSRKIGLNEQLKYTIKIESSSRQNVDEPKLPKIPNLIFRNVYTSSSMRSTMINFRMSSSYTQDYTYILIPARVGSAKIPALSVRVGNRNYSTEPIDIEILPNAQTPPTNTDPFDIFDPFDHPGYGDWNFDDRRAGETFLMSIPEKTEAYLGEPVVVSYYLYTEQGVTSLNLVEEKDFEGYGKEIFEQPSMLQFSDANFRGRRFKRSLIKRIAILPNNIGKIRAPVISATVRLYDIGYRNRNIASQDLFIKVNPLPESSKPKGFSGAIGSFQISESLGETAISLGDATTYTLIISGKGNFNQFIAPAFATTPHIQISTPLVTDKLNAGIQGKRSLIYTIIPQEKGSHSIPTLEFSWFDPSTGSYRSFQNKAATLEVKAANVFSYFTNFFQKGRSPRIKALIPIESYKSDPIYLHSFWYWLLVSLLLISLLVSSYLSYHHKLRYRDPIRFADYQAERILRKYLQEAKTAADGSSADFYPLAEKGLMHYLAEKYRIPKRLSIREKLEELERRQIPADQIKTLNEFLDRCQQIRFSPMQISSEQIGRDQNILLHLIKGFMRIKAVKKAGR